MPNLSHEFDHQLIVETSHEGAVPLHNVSQLFHNTTVSIDNHIVTFFLCHLAWDFGKDIYIANFSYLLSVCLNQSCPVKLGIFPKIIDMRNTKYLRNIWDKIKTWLRKTEINHLCGRGRIASGLDVHWPSSLYIYSWWRWQRHLWYNVSAWNHLSRE